jgi:hypothetical protein
VRIEQTQIAVRERGTLELMDLALHVTRRFALPLAATMAVGAAPVALLNAWLLRNMTIVGFDGSFAWRYAWDMTLLVFLELPLASALATTYLGQALFVERPSGRQLWRDIRASLPQLLLYQLLWRGVLPAWLLLLTISSPHQMDSGEVLMAMGCIYVAIARGLRPYLNEIVLLERNPWRARIRHAMTTARRSTALHIGSGGDLFVRSFLAAVVAAAMAVTLWYSLCFMRGKLANQTEFDDAVFAIYLPLSLWLVGGYFTVVRFLSYLDLRIRSEGWEVELRMRAEAAPLARQWL